VAPVFLSGISFGGLITLRYAISHGNRLTGLALMSTFAELTPQLLLLGNALRTGLVLGGTSYLQDPLLPMNLSDAWLGPQLGNLEAIKRQGWLTNDVYALQNLMESFLEFKPLTAQLSSISIPTMILNGEFDFLTPRALHETLRLQIPDSSLVIIPRAFHAFTLEKPALTAALLSRFAEDVLSGKWRGNRSVWIAPERRACERDCSRRPPNRCRRAPCELDDPPARWFRGWPDPVRPGSRVSGRTSIAEGEDVPPDIAGQLSRGDRNRRR
jgi:acetyl esterase/lipase